MISKLGSRRMIGLGLLVLFAVTLALEGVALHDGWPWLAIVLLCAFDILFSTASSAYLSEGES